MKKILLLFLFSLSTWVGFAQTLYHPFPDSNAVWNVTWTDNGCFLSGIPDGNYSYFLNNDTLINTINYNKLYRSGLCGFCCYPPVLPVNGYIGAIRDDSLQKKVYFVFSGNSFEQVLYDFSLSVNDTINGWLASICNDAVVSSIDSVLLNGQYYKRFNFTGTYCNGAMIEGIGSTLGLVEPFKTFEGGGTLNCFKLNQTVIYPDSFTICNILTAINEFSTIENKIKISVQSNKIVIEFLNSDLNISDFTFKLFDLLGRKYGMKKQINKGSLQFIVEQNGLYFFQIYSTKLSIRKTIKLLVIY